MYLVSNAECVPETHPDHNRLQSKPMKKVKETFGEHCCPGLKVAIGDSMVWFKGRCTMKQYMLLKLIKRCVVIFGRNSVCILVLLFSLINSQDSVTTLL